MKQKLLKLMLLLAVGMMGVSAWAQSTSTLTFDSKCEGSGTADDGVAWTVTSDGSESTFDNTKGIHYGTGSAAVQYITLSTSGISGTITQIVVNASTASGVSATVSVTVGGAAFGGDAQSLTTSATNYTFTGSASGNIVVTVTKPSSAVKALYVKSIAVTYTAGGGGGSSAVATTTTISPAGITNTDVYVGTTAGSLSASVTKTESGDAVDGATVTWSGDNNAVATIDANSGVVTLVGKGTVTFTASYAGVADEFSTSSDTYEMTVVDNTPDGYIHDIINQALTGISGTTYTEFSNKTDESNAVYAGQCAGDKSSVQLRSNNSNSGIITTTSGGYARKVSVKWNSDTTTGRTLDIYGKSTAYSAATDLYSTDAQGTKLGSIVCGTSTELTITGDYEYIGLRSNSGAMYLDEIDIAWMPATYTRSTASGNWGTLCLPYAATVEGATLYTIAGKELTGSAVTALVLAEAASVEAGKPYIFKATADDVVATFTGTDYTAAGAVNGLYGTYAAIAANTWDTYIAAGEDLYLMTTSKVQAADKETSSLAANRAYIAMSEVPEYTGSEVKGIRLGFDGTEEATAITELTEKTEATEGIYNLNGQQLSAPQRGINIIGGKKVLVK